MQSHFAFDRLQKSESEFSSISGTIPCKKMETENKSKEPELKHLGFLRIAAIQALVCVSNLYDYAKQNSGPLKSTVGTVEGVVNAVVSPVYDKFKDVPDDLLVFFDKKVDEASHKFDKHAPPVAKLVVKQANVLIRIASEMAYNLVKEALTGGPKAALSYAATEFRNLILISTVKGLAKLNQYKTLQSVIDKALPMASHLSDKYNNVVKNMSQKGAIFGYIPLVPVDEIVKAHKKGDVGETISTVADKVLPAASHLSDEYEHVVKNMSEKGGVFGHIPSFPVDEIVKAHKNEGETPKKGDADETISAVADKALPGASHLSDEYKHVVKNMSEKVGVFGHIPSVPVDEIVKAYKKEGETPKKGDADETKSSSPFGRLGQFPF